MTIKLSHIAQEKVIETTRNNKGKAIWINPEVICYWNAETENLTSLLVPEERVFNEVERGIITYYENQLKRLKDLEAELEKQQYENARFRIIGNSLLKHVHSSELEDLVYRNNMLHSGVTGPEAVKQSERILKRINDSASQEDKTSV